MLLVLFFAEICHLNGLIQHVMLNNQSTTNKSKTNLRWEQYILIATKHVRWSIYIYSN